MYGPTRNAYGPAKTMRNNFVAKKCFLESEHSDSEFYYPSELLDTEMLQLPTHSETTERKSLLSKRSNAAAHSLVPPRNENEKKWSYDKMLIDQVRSGRTGKYLALGQDAQTSLRSVHTT